MNDKLIAHANKLLKGKAIKEVKQHRPKEIIIIFEDDTRLFIDQTKDGIELSIT